MSDIDRIIENVNATMSMENMPLHDEDRERMRECLEGNKSFQETIDILIGNSNGGCHWLGAWKKCF